MERFGLALQNSEIQLIGHRHLLHRAPTVALSISGTTYWASFSEIDTAGVPEPSTFLLAGLPLLLILRAKQRR